MPLNKIGTNQIKDVVGDGFKIDTDGKLKVNYGNSITITSDKLEVKNSDTSLLVDNNGIKVNTSIIQTVAGLGSAAYTSSSSYATSSHIHSGVYEPVILTKKTAFNQDFEISTTNIKMNGSVAVGSLSTTARADHIHASDTSRVAANSAITGSTKTKITYDSKGLITSGTDATTADIGDSTDKRYCTDLQKTKLDGIATSATKVEASTINGNIKINGTETTVYTNSVSSGANYADDCRLEWNSNTDIHITSGQIDVKGTLVTVTTHIVVDSTDLESGTSLAVSTWYYVYITAAGLPKISVTAPTKDSNGNTIASTTKGAKYHTTQDWRFLGSVKTNASSQFMKFYIDNDYVMWIEQGILYIGQNLNKATSTAVNCSSYCPLTAPHAMVFIKCNSGTNVRYVGDNITWYYIGIGGSCDKKIPITNNSIYYQSSTNTLDIAIAGYYEYI